MEKIQILLLTLLLAIIGILVYVFFIRKDKKPEDSESLLLMQQQIQELSRTVREQMSESSKLAQEGSRMQFRESKELMQEINKEVNEQIRSIQESISEKLLGVQKHVSEVSESSKQVFTIAEQLQNLEKVLKHQKQRGNLGEASLQLALENILPVGAYKLQYQFDGGETVDAVILTKDGMIPVDAKFSLDNYRRLVDETDQNRREDLEKEFKNDLKKRIDETAKYIRPKDGTLPFAFMFIPAEAIYYDLLVNEVGSVKVNTRSLLDYAYRDKNVIIVSPTTFAAYLQSVLYGFRAFKVEESAKEIQKNVEKLTRHLSAYTQYFDKVGNSLGTTVNHYNQASKELGKVDKDLMKITSESIEHENLTLDKPIKAE
ncbi:MAG: DNA recombination protein RmuC [Candidatus Nomurabacteria bacterium]|nr:MAG: DNA recombination protein RmuC [Candidatus Nomurabacteria bacterium]